MDAATAALWASSITGAVALGGALLVPHLTAKRARETELLKMRRDTYLTALQLASSAMKSGLGPDELRTIRNKMYPITTELLLLGNEDLAQQYNQIADLIGTVASLFSEGKKADKEISEFGRLLRLFIDTVRAHLGVDDLDR